MAKVETVDDPVLFETDQSGSDVWVPTRGPDSRPRGPRGVWSLLPPLRRTFPGWGSWGFR